MGTQSMRFGCHLVTYGSVEQTVRYAVLAEKCGFDTVTVPDHLFHPLTRVFLKKPPWEAFTVIAAIASHTTRIRMMPAVTDSVRRHPALLAHTVATLDHISGGRISLGIGAGEAYNIVPLRDVKWDRPYTRFEEALSLVKALWSSTKERPTNFDGDYFKLRQAYQSFKPLQKPHPPIYVGGYGPKMRLLTGAEGNGWLPWIHAPETYAKDLKLIVESAKRSGRSVEEIETAVITPTLVLSDPDKAWELATPRNRVGLALRASLLKKMGYSKLAKKATHLWSIAFTDKQIEQVMKVAEEIPLEAVKKVTAAGTADDAIQQIDNYLKAGVSHFIAQPLIENFEETTTAYRDKIIPYFKELGR